MKQERGYQTIRVQQQNPYSACRIAETGQAQPRRAGYQVNSISNSVLSSSTSNSIFRATSSGTFATNRA
jgi:hypothetical protein